MSADSRNTAQAQGASAEPVQDMWSATGLYPAFSTVSYLLSRDGSAGGNPWRGKVKLVSKGEREVWSDDDV